MASANRKMLYQYLKALLPALVTIGGWQAAAWAFHYVGCTGNIKYLQSCFAGSMDIMPVVGLGLFWCQILSPVCVPISGGLVLGVLARQIAARRGWQDRVIWPSVTKQAKAGRGRYRRRAPH